MFTNRSYYKAGNLETVHFLTKLNILLKSNFCLFFLNVCILKLKKNWMYIFADPITNCQGLVTLIIIVCYDITVVLCVQSLTGRVISRHDVGKIRLLYTMPTHGT